MKSLQFIIYFHARKMILNFFSHNLKNLSFYSSIPKKLGGKITHDLGTNQKRFTNVLCMAKDYVILIIQFVAHLPPVLTLWLQPQQQIFRAYQIDPRPPAAPADLVAPSIGRSRPLLGWEALPWGLQWGHIISTNITIISTKIVHVFYLALYVVSRYLNVTI